MKLSEIAKQVGGRVEGEDIEIGGVASLGSATARNLVFVDDEKHLAAALGSKAAAVIAGEFAAHPGGQSPGTSKAAKTAPPRKPLIIARQPKLAFAKAVALLHPARRTPSGVHSSAQVHESVKVGKGVAIGPHAVVAEDAVIGDRTAIGAGSFVGAGVSIGAGCDIKSNVSIYPGTTLGERVIVHSGAVLGSDGFGFVRDEDSGQYTKFPQVGRLEIGDDVEIGANTTLDRGALDATVIGRGTKIDNLVQVAHNVRIGQNVVISAQTGISGSTVIEDNVIIAGQVGIADHVTIESGAILGAQCGVPTGKVIRGKGVVFWGTPARPIREYLKELAVLARMAKR